MRVEGTLPSARGRSRIQSSELVITLNLTFRQGVRAVDLASGRLEGVGWDKLEGGVLAHAASGSVGGGVVGSPKQGCMLLGPAL